MKSQYTLKTMTESQRATLAYARKHGKVLIPVLKAIEKSGLCGLINAYFCSGDLTMGISGDSHTLGATWAILRKAGFKCTSERPAANQPSWSGWFNVDSGEPSDARIFLSFSSTVCKRVQVGVETKEVPVYEVQCA